MTRNAAMNLYTINTITSTIFCRIMKEISGWFNNNELIKTTRRQLKLLVNFDAKDFENVHAILCDNQNNIWQGTERGVIKYQQ